MQSVLFSRSSLFPFSQSCNSFLQTGVRSSDLFWQRILTVTSTTYQVPAFFLPRGCGKDSRAYTVKARMNGGCGCLCSTVRQGPAS